MARKKSAGLNHRDNDDEARKTDQARQQIGLQANSESPAQQAGKGWRSFLPIHPLANKFPLLSETDPAALRAMADDIKKNGLREPVIIAGVGVDDVTTLLDGRNRLDALELLNINLTPARFRRRGPQAPYNLDEPARTLPGHVDPVAYIVSANIHRRHLTAEKKRELIEELIKADPTKSDRVIAGQMKVDKNVVSRLRKKAEATGATAPVEKRTGKDGRARKQPAKGNRTIAPHRRELAERMQRDFQASKIENFHSGNVPTKEGRAEQSKIIDAGLKVLAKDAHPDHGGSTEDMQRLNAARDDLKKNVRKVVVDDWWKQESRDIAAQMAKHMTIKRIAELCAMAIDLRKAKQAQDAAKAEVEKAAAP